MTLYLDGPCSPTETITVTMNIQKCPPGFELPIHEPVCVCADRLQKYTNTCLIDSATVLREQDAEYWVSYSSSDDRGLILHPHCPFDFCTSEEVYINVSASDKQCNYNRIGVLCGRCSKSLSLVFGSSRCLKCSDLHTSLLAAFGLAGMALISFLLVLQLTVSAGTINGLIFYANVVTMNSATFFKSTHPNILTVFIAWLNFDLGIETCFYDGMDAYIKTWLQFAFPMYLWVVVGLIIIVSHYSGTAARIFGSNPVSVLATLFLLSYTKLLRTIIAALSYTTVEYPRSSIAVWLYDGNIGYVSSKHIPLFAVALFCLIFLFLPYTLLLTFGQWLQAKSEWKVFSCVNSRYLNPFLDACHAPYSNEHRYWTGLMLLLRLILSLISAVNALGDPRINLLAVAVSVALILTTILAGSGVYKTRYLGLLEVSFLLNMMILVLSTLYVHPNSKDQSALTLTSVGIAFATFTGIVIYHFIQQLKNTTWFKNSRLGLWQFRSSKAWKIVFRSHAEVKSQGTIESSGPNCVVSSHSLPTQTVISLSELREPCMETD